MTDSVALKGIHKIHMSCTEHITDVMSSNVKRQTSEKNLKWCEGIIQFRRIYLFFYIQFIFQYVSHIHYVTFIDNLFQEILEIRMGLKFHI